MRNEVRDDAELGRFLRREDGAATFDWLLLAASLATLAAVSIDTALGGFSADSTPAAAESQTSDAAPPPQTGPAG